MYTGVTKNLNQSRRRPSLAGFTLIELLVSVSIIAVVSGLFMANYKAGARRSALINGAQKLTAEINLVKGYALGSKDLNGMVPLGGWGIYFNSVPPDNRYYTIFGDKNGMQANKNHIYDAADDIYAQNIFQEGVVIVKNVGLKGFENPTNKGSIVFLPPDPTVYFDGVEVTDKVVQIILEDTIYGTTKTVEINSFGLVDVID